MFRSTQFFSREGALLATILFTVLPLMLSIPSKGIEDGQKEENQSKTPKESFLLTELSPSIAGGHQRPSRHRRQVGPQYPQGQAVTPVLVAWDPQARRYVLIGQMDPRAVGVGGQSLTNLRLPVSVGVGAGQYGVPSLGQPLVRPPYQPRPGTWPGEGQGQWENYPFRDSSPYVRPASGTPQRRPAPGTPQRRPAPGSSQRRPTGANNGLSNRRPAYPLNNDPPVISCPSDINVTAEESKVTAMVSWNEPQAEDQEDGDLTPSLLSLLGPGSDFPIGVHMVQYEAVDSKGAVVRCNFVVTVRAVLCPPIPRIPSLQHDCTVSGIIYGKVCNFRCVGGYQLNGDRSVRCTEKGVFDKPVPSCSRRKCPALTLPPGGVYFHCSDADLYGSLCYIQCDMQQGFRTVYGRDATRCGPNGDWLGSAICVDEQPPEFTSCPLRGVVVYADVGASGANATWELPQATDNSGEVNVTQVKGEPPGAWHRLGEHQVAYVTEDRAGNRAVCAFRVLVLLRSCSQPSWPADPYLKNQCTDDLMHGSECTLWCTMGRELQGSKMVTCELNETNQVMYWKMPDGPPHCQEPQADEEPPCPDPLPPPNAFFSCGRTSRERMCRMGCQDGYDFPRTVDPNTLNTCRMSEGQWSMPDPPPCLPLRRPDQLQLPVEARFRGRCRGADDTERLRDRFGDFLTQSSYRSACPGSGNCGYRNLRCSCLPQGEQPLPGQMVHIRLPVLQVQLVPILFHWDLFTDFQISPAQPPEAALDRNAGVLRGLAAEIEREMEEAFKDSLEEEDGQIPEGLDGIPGSTTGLRDQMAFESMTYEDVMIVCPDGMEASVNRVSCMSCPPGMYIRPDGSCQSCPIDTYQDEEAGPQCKPCPPGTSTASTGTRREEDCRPQRDLPPSRVSRPSSSIPGPESDDDTDEPTDGTEDSDVTTDTGAEPDADDINSDPKSVTDDYTDAETPDTEAETEGEVAETDTDPPKIDVETSEGEGETPEDDSETPETDVPLEPDMQTSENDVETPEVDTETTGTDTLEAQVPERDSETPETDGETPETDGEGPESEGRTPESDTETPETDTETAETNDEMPETDAETPEAKDEIPESNAETPRTDAETPDTVAETPKLDADTPKIDPEAPEKDANTSKIDAETPEKDADTTKIYTDAPEKDVNASTLDADAPEKDADTSNIDTDAPEKDAEGQEKDAEGQEKDTGAPKTKGRTPKTDAPELPDSEIPDTEKTDAEKEQGIDDVADDSLLAPFVPDVERRNIEKEPGIDVNRPKTPSTSDVALPDSVTAASRSTSVPITTTPSVRNNSTQRSRPSKTDVTPTGNDVTLAATKKPPRTSGNKPPVKPSPTKKTVVPKGPKPPAVPAKPTRTARPTKATVTPTPASSTGKPGPKSSVPVFNPLSNLPRRISFVQRSRD